MEKALYIGQMFALVFGCSSSSLHLLLPNSGSIFEYCTGNEGVNVRTRGGLEIPRKGRKMSIVSELK